MVHPIFKRSNYESFKIHSPYNWMACITNNLIYNILSLIPVIVLGLRAPHSPTVLFLIQITILLKIFNELTLTIL
ncbi:hypothetical protein CN290_28515 [Bacillus cereus]|uniref:Uncharacterized protein n=1 Tax=Bacillus cereus TaxID=1396 RepID=A0A2A8XXP6_BACCE|nr:hypothetical protein CN290_28515 [Bacillus cereus]PFR16492.1 hypothetical protein COK23_25320 [Bacillus cereus]